MENLRPPHQLSRRDVICVGGISAFGLTLDHLTRPKSASAKDSTKSLSPRAKACILIWLDGGPSHLETFDVKPDAPVEVRGPLNSIATRVPGIRVSECLPRTAQAIDKLAVVRSMTSPLGEHNFGTHYLMTGYKPTPAIEYPAFGAVVTHLRASGRELPPNVAVPDFRVGGSKLSGGGYLPSSTHPFSIGADPAKRDFAVRDLAPYQGVHNTRLSRRRRFAKAMDQLSPAIDGSHENPDLERAYDLITSTSAKQAFDLSQEPVKLRQRYGRKSIGQSCLLARRLVERGVPFVTVNNRGWDTHENLLTRLKEGYTGAPEPGVGLVPSLDLSLSALLEDLEDRGMLDETLVVVMGEFGRTPKLNTAGGRDHWPRVFSVGLAGGGIQGGQVIGRSDAVGESPAERPVTPSDLAATIFTLLGVDPQRELRTNDGRPIRISPHDAKVVPELLS